ncbi:MAG: hypothetical protein KAS36_11910, partial [Anaerolineales bacterium]|nr:hypothetical protein [Anaerolineales bacterium]
CLCHGFKHLPISGNEWFTHHFLTIFSMILTAQAGIGSLGKMVYLGAYAPHVHHFSDSPRL